MDPVKALEMPGVADHLPLMVIGVFALAAIGGAMMAIVVKALSVHRWLLKHFRSLDDSIAGLRTAIGERFAAHEKDERKWQSEIGGKVEDVRERLARMEGQLSASADDRARRRAEERRAPGEDG